MDHQAIAQLLGNYGEFLGSIAVLVTVLYLAIQVRQARNQLSLAGRQARADAAREVLHQLSDIAPIAAKLEWPSYGDFGLDEEENVRFGAWCHSWMRSEEMIFRAVTDPEEEATQRQLLTFWMSTPWGKEFWDKNKAIYDDTFARVMDECGEVVQQRSASPESLLARRQ